MRLAFFTKNRTNPAYQAARLGAERTAARLGAGVEHYVPVKPDDVDEQKALVAKAIAERPDAFVFVPVHVTAMDEAIADVFAAGLPVVNYLNRMRGGGFVSFVGSDDYRLAFGIAEHLARHLGGRGKVALVEGTAGALTSADRVRGFRDALKGFPGIEVLASLKGEYQREEARAATDAFLASSAARPDAMIVANDLMALGVIEALEARGVRALVTGVNAVPDGIDAIKRGALLATADFDALKIASIATEAAIRHLRGERVPREILLPTQIVHAGNYGPWDKPLEARDLPRWEDAVMQS